MPGISFHNRFDRMSRYHQFNQIIQGETIGWICGRRITRDLTPAEYDFLLPYLTHQKNRLRWQAADKLGKIGDSRAVNPLINTLRDENWLVRLHAVKALGRIGSPNAIEPIISIMNDECIYVRRAIMRVLGKEPFVKDPRVTEILLHALSDADRCVRAWSVWSLSYIGSSNVVRAIADAVSDPDNNVSWRAIDALQQIGIPAINVLIQLLESSNGEVRYRSVKALGKIGDVRALDAIKGVLDDPDVKVRWRAKLAHHQLTNQKP